MAVESLESSELLTLRNVGGGELERDFQEQLREALGVFAEPDNFESDRDGLLTCRITLEVTVTGGGESEIVGVTCRSALKKPKRRRAHSACHVERGKLIVQPMQPTLFSMDSRSTDA